MKHNTILTLCIAALAASSQAAVIHFNDYENETSAGLGTLPSNMGFTDGGGDHVGQSGLGVADANPRSGTYNYAISNTTINPNAPDPENSWGGTWSGASSLGGPGSSVVDQATAEANGTSANPLSYVNITEGTTFTISSWAATDGANPLISATVNTHVRLEFSDGVTSDIIPRVLSSNLTASTLTTDYQLLTATYTITAADILAGVDRVTAVVASDGHGFGNGTGLIYHDDFLFEVDDASFVTIPEPSTSFLGLLGVLGLTYRRRR